MTTHFEQWYGVRFLGAEPTSDATGACADNGQSVSAYVEPDPNTPDQPYSWQVTCSGGRVCTGGAERDVFCVDPQVQQPPAFTPGDWCKIDDRTDGVYDAQGACVQAGSFPGDDCIGAGGQVGYLDSYLHCVLPAASAPPKSHINPALLAFSLPGGGGPPPPPPPPDHSKNKKKQPGQQQQGQTAPETTSSSIWPWVLGGAAVLAAAGGIYVATAKPSTPAKAKKK
jgi:hypothetical protein